MGPSSSLTPMLRQYLEAKAAHPDAVLLYRMGDFYEMFFEDAVRAAPILEVTLTARHRGSDNEAPMCGVPHHALDGYVGKLLKAGLKVAICDQVEDAAAAKGSKGLVRREVTRVVTPGTVSEPSLLDGKEENLLAALLWRGEEGAGAFLDVSTGRLTVRRWRRPEEALEDLRALAPREVLHPDGDLPAAVAGWLEAEVACRTPLAGDRWLDRGRAAALLERHFETATLRGFGLEPGEPAVEAAAAALAYARETQQSDLGHVREILLRESRDEMVLDATTVANLEIFRGLREPASSAAGRGAAGRRARTLLAVLDRTATPPGGRLLRDWLRRPLRDPVRIAERHAAVGDLVAEPDRRQRLRALLGQVADLERLLARASLRTLQPREAAALRDSLAVVPGIFAELAGAGAELLQNLAATDPAAALQAELARLLEPSPAAAVQDGGVIAAGVDPELDRARSLARDSKRHILAVEQRERERTGISSLKVRYNRVFGYYLEVTKANQHLVPADYIRKQTLVNAERYVTPEVKELEEQILDAEERQVAIEVEHYRRLLAVIAAEAAPLSRLARAVATADVLAAFAEAAVRRGYVRPWVVEAGGPIRIRGGRHPVVERLGGEPFVPNDAELDGEGARIVVLTGPNMGGKSTYLRQVALIVLMAQAGAFVPAAEATIGAVDRIFTRVGASDDLARGESTFMVEMIETANILRHATPESLVILDEVGRGTSTFDGLSLAWAVVEHLHEKVGARTLFATHYHELTELAALLPGVVNRTLAVKEWEDRIVFLRRVVPGSADRSYGLQVARLAGVPPEVVARAGEILANLETQEYDLTGKPMIARGAGGPPGAGGGPDQLRLFAPPEQVVAALLAGVDLDGLTPLAALELLQELKRRLEGRC